MPPKISVLIYTARSDHPYEDRSWHCFDPAVKTLAAQTMPFADFELVLVDMHWESRRDYFLQHPQPFAVKHVPSSPNRWQARRRTGLCEQINRGFAWADGQLVQMGGENNMFPPHFLETAWRMFSSTGRLPVSWYAICGAASPTEPADGLARSSAARRHPRMPRDIDFNLLGFTPEHIDQVDHRAHRFADAPGLQASPCHHQNYFGYSTVSAQAILDTNGFDELFDGQWGLFDCDFGSRLDLAGYRMSLARDLYIIEPPVAPTGLKDGVVQPAYAGIGHQEAFKCHYAIYLHNRATGRRVNRPLPETYIDDVKKLACFDQCGLKDKCRAGQVHAATPSPPGGTPPDGSASQYIGESKYYPFCEGKHREAARELFANPSVRDLAEDKAKRLAGAHPFDRATVVLPAGPARFVVEYDAPKSANPRAPMPHERMPRVASSPIRRAMRFRKPPT